MCSPIRTADRPLRERSLRVGGRSQCVSGLYERDEERIALGVDLDPLMALKGLTQVPAVLGEDVGIRVAQFVEKPGGAVDVGEEQRHVAARQ